MKFRVYSVHGNQTPRSHFSWLNNSWLDFWFGYVIFKLKMEYDNDLGIGKTKANAYRTIYLAFIQHNTEKRIKMWKNVSQ